MRNETILAGVYVAMMVGAISVGIGIGVAQRRAGEPEAETTGRALFAASGPGSIRTTCREARLVRAVNGDTFDVQVRHRWGEREMIETNVRIRLAEADTPETDGDERADGLVVEQQVSRWLAECEDGAGPWPLIACADETDSFGRPLSEVYCKRQGVELNEWLLDFGYARPYGEPWEGLP